VHREIFITFMDLIILTQLNTISLMLQYQHYRKYYGTILMKKYIIILIMICINASSCDGNSGPGFRFDLFKNTAGWDLAQAVEKQDTNKIIKLLKDTPNYINIQEPVYGQTLLQLAISNDKDKSVKTLLENGADVNIVDLTGDAAIHHATRFLSFKKHRYEMLSLLIKYGANVNQLSVHVKDKDSSDHFLPLMGAVQDLKCASLLLENGADLYAYDNNTYTIWWSMLLDDQDDGVITAKYMIVDKKMPVPDPISYTVPNRAPLDIFGLLGKSNYINGSARKEKAKKEIIHYLQLVQFPKMGVYAKP
jgi:hypothetical protein